MATIPSSRPPPPPPQQQQQQQQQYEETHVHGVYDAIAPHFSATRHTPWPFVAAFLAAQPPGSVGLDVGCGNGKNMGVNRDVVMLGCDRSAALVALARDMWCRGSGGGGGDVLAAAAAVGGADVAVADSLGLPFRAAAADFAICIAVIHHLSTRERRVAAIRQLLACVRRRGRVLVYVWALEQRSSRRGWDAGGEQDLLVPWVMKAPQAKKQKKAAAAAAAAARTKGRRHQAKADDGSDGSVLILAPSSGGEGGEQEQGGSSMQGQQQQRQRQDEAAAAAAAERVAGPPEKEKGSSADEGRDGQTQQQQADKTFHRYYHLYRKGELEEDAVAAGGEVLSSGYERDNWWVIIAG